MAELKGSCIRSKEQDLVMHNIQTSPGNSGSPIFRIDEKNKMPYVMAIHTDGDVKVKT